MKSTEQGWVMINTNHPNNPNNENIFTASFRYLKRDCIADFIKDSSEDWKYWRKKYNFRCVKATQTIVINGGNE